MDKIAQLIRDAWPIHGIEEDEACEELIQKVLKETIVEYDIWKITNAGRQPRRFYESEKQFRRHFNRFKKEYSRPWGAYRLTSNGWKRILK